jgi:hypothetical protein
MAFQVSGTVHVESIQDRLGTIIDEDADDDAGDVDFSLLPICFEAATKSHNR